jgi:hypothetical protein
VIDPKHAAWVKFDAYWVRYNELLAICDGEQTLIGGGDRLPGGIDAEDFWHDVLLGEWERYARDEWELWYIHAPNPETISVVQFVLPCLDDAYALIKRELVHGTFEHFPLLPLTD